MRVLSEMGVTQVATPKEIQSLKIKGLREIKANLNTIVKDLRSERSAVIRVATIRVPMLLVSP